MHHKTQAKLIKQIVSKNKPNQLQADFRQLQLHWYRKLDSTGFDDIERVGTLRSKYYNEYGGHMKSCVPRYAKENAFSSLTHYSLHSLFSYHATPASKMSVIDLKLLRLYASGATISRMSKDLRRYYSHYQTPSKPGPKGKPYSTYWVHGRLAILKQAVHNWYNSPQYGLDMEHSLDPGEVEKPVECPGAR